MFFYTIVRRKSDYHYKRSLDSLKRNYNFKWCYITFAVIVILSIGMWFLFKPHDETYKMTNFYIDSKVKNFDNFVVNLVSENGKDTISYIHCLGKVEMFLIQNKRNEYSLDYSKEHFIKNNIIPNSKDIKIGQTVEIPIKPDERIPATVPIIIFILLLTNVVYFIATFFINIIRYIIFFFENYKIINRQVYNYIKFIDPYGEENWFDE